MSAISVNMQQTGLASVVDVPFSKFKILWPLTPFFSSHGTYDDRNARFVQTVCTRNPSEEIA